MVGKQITFYATSDVYDIIKDSGIEEKKQSKWINEKIKQAVFADKQPIENKERAKGEIIGVELEWSY